jgi:hypothetical protein
VGQIKRVAEAVGRQVAPTHHLTSPANVNAAGSPAPVAL